jgi:Domain of unknown function (DUF1330)
MVAKPDPTRIYEAARSELTVLVRFNSVAGAAALYDSARYREALAALGSDAIRDVRIMPALYWVITWSLSGMRYPAKSHIARRGWAADSLGGALTASPAFMTQSSIANIEISDR